MLMEKSRMLRVFDLALQKVTGEGGVSMYANNKVEIRVSGVSHSLKKELFRIVEQKQKALETKRYSLSDLVVEVLEDYVGESYQEEAQEEQRDFLNAVAKEVSKIDALDRKMNLLIQSLNANTGTLQKVLNEL